MISYQSISDEFDKLIEGIEDPKDTIKMGASSRTQNNVISGEKLRKVQKDTLTDLKNFLSMTFGPMGSNTKIITGGYMRKKLLIIFMMLFAVNVNASTNVKVKNIKIEDVSVTIKDTISYNEEVKVTYTINPNDAKNKALTWEVKGVKKGVKVEFVNGKTTKDASGEVLIKFSNDTEKDVSLTLNVKQNNKVLFTKKLNVQSKENTNNRLVSEVTDLINGIDNKLTKSNYESNKSKVLEVGKLLENEEVKSLLDGSLLDKYNTALNNVNNYSSNNKVTIIISGILVVVFALLIYWIFKKED